MWFGGNGEWSGKELDFHLRQIKEAFIMLGGMQQGPREPEAEEEIRDYVRDIAAALTGYKIEFTEELPYPGDLPTPEMVEPKGFFMGDASLLKESLKPMTVW